MKDSSDANLAKNIYKLKEKATATFYSPSEECVLLVSSTKEPGERKIVVDSRAGMHMISKKDLNSAELETMRISRNPTRVMTANGEVQTKRRSHGICQRIGLIRDSDASGRNTRRFFRSESSARIMGILTHWTSGQKPHLTKKGKRIESNISNYVPLVVPGLSTRSSVQHHDITHGCGHVS